MPPLSLTLTSPLPPRVVQVLKDFLTEELAFIDAAMGDGIVTPPVLDENFFERDRRSIGTYPAVTIHTRTASPVEVRPKQFGSRVDAHHHLDVLFHLTASLGNAETLQELSHRYAAGAIRVLCILHESLDTIEDPTRFVERCDWTTPINYGTLLPGQQEGTVVRTVTVPLDIRLREARTE